MPGGDSQSVRWSGSGELRAEVAGGTVQLGRAQRHHAPQSGQIHSVDLHARALQTWLSSGAPSSLLNCRFLGPIPELLDQDLMERAPGVSPRICSFKRVSWLYDQPWKTPLWAQREPESSTMRGSVDPIGFRTATWAAGQKVCWQHGKYFKDNWRSPREPGARCHVGLHRGGGVSCMQEMTRRAVDWRWQCQSGDIQRRKLPNSDVRAASKGPVGYREQRPAPEAQVCSSGEGGGAGHGSDTPACPSSDKSHGVSSVCQALFKVFIFLPNSI